VIRLARLSVRRPRLSLITWLIVAGALSLIGLGVTGSLTPTITTVAGTQSARAEHLAKSQFGPSVLVPILLEGPPRALDRQGPVLVRTLGARRDTRVLSAWDTGPAGEQLRPRRNAAVVLAAVARTEDAMVDRVQGQIDRTVERVISAPVRSSITGTPSIDRAMKDRAIDTTQRSLALTVPILFGVLLLILRAPLAALALTVLGAGTAFASIGIMTILGKSIAVDAVAVTTASMIGLALGVGYGLLIYRRWRTEMLADVSHHDAAHAAITAVETTGRAVLVGGTALIVALLLAPMIADSEILTSIGVGSLLCATLSVGAATVVMPAFLVVAGRRTEAMTAAAPGPILAAWERLTAGGGWVVRHAVPVGAAATALLAALALPLLTLETGPPSPKLLPASDAARQSFERVAAVMGPGWPTPYNIVVVSRKQPITSAKMLAELDRFQTSLAKDARIESITGPGAFAATSKDLGVLPKQLKSSGKLLKTSKRDLLKLQLGLNRAGNGVLQLKGGLEDASGGAGQLQGGSAKAQGGAGQLHAGLAKARDGASQISGGLAVALSASRKLRDGAGAALKGSGQITSGLKQASVPLKSGLPAIQQMSTDVNASKDAVSSAATTAGALNAQLDEAAAQIAQLPASAEKTAAAAAVASANTAAGGLESSLQSSSSTLTGAAAVSSAVADQTVKLSNGLTQLYAGSQALESGIGQLQDGNSKLAAGIGKLSGGGSQLTTGVTALRDGAGQLEAGLGQLTGGAGQLASGLTAGIGPTGQLATGLGVAEAKVAKSRRAVPSTKDLERLQRESPGLFYSGYFVLSAIEGAPSAQRNQASFLVDLEGGGNAGQITVIPTQGIESTSTQELGVDLQRKADAFAAKTGTEVSVGGPAGSLSDFRSETASRIWPVVIITSVVVALLMMALLKTVVLPVVAVAFDLLTCAATFGIMTLLFGGDNPPLGGPGYLDPMSIIGIFSVVFGLSMVYEVHLLHRTREALVGGEDAESALRHGLRETAAAGTGAALVMVATIIPFATTGLLTIREFGVGVAIAIILDALIVRPVLLPAAVKVLGPRGWWPTRRGAEPDAEAMAPPTPPRLATPVGGGVA
jgi:RND superfamily putative drug exporter